jgi:hypothetical protein
MWAQQRGDGAWDWLDFELDPWEEGDDFGAALAALVAGSIPAGSTSAQAAGTTKLVGYIRHRLELMTLHDRTVVLWASGKLAGLLDRARANAIAAELAATQRADGGFSVAAWGHHAKMGSQESDGYATAVAVLALCSGTEQGASRSDVQRGLSWLAHHQEEDGSWQSGSMNEETELGRRFMTDAATAYASLALIRCVPAPGP